MKAWSLEDFVAESNRIEGIVRRPTIPEIEAHERFLPLAVSCPALTIQDMVNFVFVIAPHARLRDSFGLDVKVGDHVAPLGAPGIKQDLNNLLHWANKKRYRTKDAYDLHLAYENLHPFTDGNGRSGRALWLWMVGGIEAAPLGFLHQFYYDTLDAASNSGPDGRRG